MMKAVTSVIRFLVFTNIYIAICVVCFTSKTALLLYGNTGNTHVNILAFSATLFLYSFHRVYRRNRLFEDEHKEERHYWVDKRKTMYYGIVAIAFIVAATQMVYMPLRVWELLIPIGFIAGGYSVPFIKTTKGYIRLRDISWLKVLWIALAYAMLATFLPVAYSYSFQALLQPGVQFIFAENFLFIFVLAIPFDIRDINYDKRNGVNTIPVLLGVKGAITVCFNVLLIFITVAWFHNVLAGLKVSYALALSISAIEVACFTWFSKPERPNLFFPLAIESSMILQWLLIFCMAYFV